MGCGMRVAGALLALAVLIALPLVASAQAPVPPTGTYVVAVLVSDGTVMHPVSASVVPEVQMCGPFVPEGGQ